MNRSTLAIFLGEWLPKIEFEIRDVLGNSEAEVANHYGMMHYHMGWVDENLRPVHLLAGKRLRPIFLILACAEVGTHCAPFRRPRQWSCCTTFH